MNRTKPFRYLHFISMLFVTALLGSFVLAYKMVAIGKYMESGAVFIFPLVYALADITAEVYGYTATKKIVRQAFYCCLIFSIFISFIAWLPEPTDWAYQGSYNFVLGNIFRLFVASAVGLMVGISVNGYLICRWQCMLKGRLFWLRSIGSAAIGQLTTSLITDSIAFAGMMAVSTQLKLMLAIYVAKVIYAILLAWPCTLMVMHLKVQEGIELYRNDIHFNPFGETEKG